MYTNRIKVETLFLVVCLAVCVWGCGDSDGGPVDPVGPNDELGLMYDDPVSAGRPVPSFQQDILPILTSRCALSGCHVAGGPHGVDLRTYETLQKRGEDGAIIVAGNADESELVEKFWRGKCLLVGPG